MNKIRRPALQFSPTQDEQGRSADRLHAIRVGLGLQYQTGPRMGQQLGQIRSKTVG